jgi:hypothetical protein
MLVTVTKELLEAAEIAANAAAQNAGRLDKDVLEHVPPLVPDGLLHRICTQQAEQMRNSSDMLLGWVQRNKARLEELENTR